jgi:hypothetical protein
MILDKIWQKNYTISKYFRRGDKNEGNREKMVCGQRNKCEAGKARFTCG